MIKKPAQEFKEDPNVFWERYQLCNSVASLIKHSQKLHEREMKLTAFKSDNRFLLNTILPAKRVKRNNASSQCQKLDTKKSKRKVFSTYDYTSINLASSSWLVPVFKLYLLVNFEKSVMIVTRWMQCCRWEKISSDLL